MWLWLWLWFCTAVWETKPSLDIVHWPSSIPVSNSGVSSGNVISMKDFHHCCKYSTGEDLTLTLTRRCNCNCQLKEMHYVCCISSYNRRVFYIISRMYHSVHVNTRIEVQKVPNLDHMTCSLATNLGPNLGQNKPKRGRLAHKQRQLEKDWLANRDKEREIVSQTATIRERLACKPWQREGDCLTNCDN